IDVFAEACDLRLHRYDQAEPIIGGADRPCTIRELSHLIAKVVGFQGEVVSDLTKPDGAPKRLLEASAIRRLGWSPKTDLKSGLEKTYRWFLEKGDKRCAS
ncbi:MAG: GDP-L-fucose synthase, partial [Deltaproteobacteria bacterium]|nr:GDP-L-fucose synthase [Deltaproteobacteria bacterium]